MRLLANENLPGEAVAALRQAGHEVEWVRVDAPGARDEEVLARAESEERILITFDKDFGELAYGAHLRATKGIILLRISAPSPGAVSNLIVTALSTRQDLRWPLLRHRRRPHPHDPSAHARTVWR